MDDFKFDETPKPSYNSDNNANASEPTVIDMRRQTPLNDPKCHHDFQHDPKDGDAHLGKVYKCTKCPFGFIAQ